MKIQRLELPNGKEVAILISAEAGIRCYQKKPEQYWEPFDPIILNQVKLPGYLLVAQQEF